MSGMTGNKGCVSIRFLINDTSFCFINVHFESGQKAIKERIENFRNVYAETFNDFTVMSTQEKVYHDYQCIFGDMNFRIDKTNEQVRDLIQRKDYQTLQSCD